MTTPIGTQIKRCKARGYTTVEGFFVPHEVEAMQRAMQVQGTRLVERRVGATDASAALWLAPQEPLPFRQRFLPQPKPSCHPCRHSASLRRPKSDRLLGWRRLLQVQPRFLRVREGILHVGEVCPRQG